MVELELIGLDADGEHLLLAGPSGSQHRLVVDEALRAAVRRDRPHLESIRAGGVALRPKEIQERIRAGATAEEVAEVAGMPLEHVRRYEGAVLAERAWVAQQAQRLTIGRGLDSPALGDLVTDRLAARQVRPSDLDWDAVRTPDRTWELIARFVTGDRQREARWHVDIQSGTARALDDEARWLSERDAATGTVARRHLSPVRVYDAEADGDVAPALHAVDAEVNRRRDRREIDDPAGHDDTTDTTDTTEETPDTTHDLLAELRASRGVRQSLDLTGFGDSDEAGDDAPSLWQIPPAAHPPASRPDEATDAQVLPWPGSVPAIEPDEPSSAASPESAAPEQEPGPRRRPKNWRASVPSWDEIVFGARPD